MSQTAFPVHPITFSTHPDTVGLLRHESGAVSLSAARHRACLEAAWEIEALARLLPDLALRDDDALPLQVRGVARRLGDLAGAVMSGLDDGVVVDKDVNWPDSGDELQPIGCFWAAGRE